MIFLYVWVGSAPVFAVFLIYNQTVSPSWSSNLPFPGGTEAISGAAVYGDVRPESDIPSFPGKVSVAALPVIRNASVHSFLMPRAA